MPRPADLWWKNAVIYCLDVQTFFDTDGDGIGDFAGLTEKVDYLAGLGVTCIWLMPIYPTADRDDGYDISEHYGIDARLGSFGDFTEFVRTARDRGMRVIVDLVVNHTSDQHPWFQSARRSRESRFRDFYVWRDEVPDDGPQGEVFPGRQGGIWSYDTEAGQYYLHRFYRHQPDLNIAAAEVRDEIAKVIGFWLAQGLSGFRVDAVPFLLEVDGIDEKMEVAPHQYLRAYLRAFINSGGVGRGPARRGQFAVRGTAEVLRRRGRRRAEHAVRLHRHAGDPPLDGRHDARPIAKRGRSVNVTRRGHPTGRSHRSCATTTNSTLYKLSERERGEVFDAFGPDPDMQLYGRGLRRRLPTMLEGDDRPRGMAYSLMFSMPGAPTLFYGEEIGMGENLAIEGRLAVRTPMQWVVRSRRRVHDRTGRCRLPSFPHRRSFRA